MGLIWNRCGLALASGALAGAMLLGTATPASAWYRNPAETLAVLPASASAPEGLTVGADGNLYVTTFGYDAAGEVAGPGHLYVLTPDGQLVRDVVIQGSTSHQLGIAFNPVTSELLAIDAGAGVVRRVDPQNGAASVFMTAGPGALLNGLAFDPAGNTYVTDSANGIVWVVGPLGGAGRIWVQDPLLTTTGVPAFGANGIGFNHDYTAAFVANTGNDTVLRIPVANGQAGQTAVFVNSINGADGLVLDGQDNLWVAANQADEIVVVDPTGKAIGKLGDFRAVRGGVPLGLLFPASPAFSANGEYIYVTNLSLDLRVVGAVQSVVSQYAAQVRRYTVSRISTRLRPLPGASRLGE